MGCCCSVTGGVCAGAPLIPPKKFFTWLWKGHHMVARGEPAWCFVMFIFNRSWQSTVHSSKCTTQVVFHMKIHHKFVIIKSTTRTNSRHRDTHHLPWGYPLNWAFQPPSATHTAADWATSRNTRKSLVIGPNWLTYRPDLYDVEWRCNTSQKNKALIGRMKPIQMSMR